ncbi:transcription elongation factor GreA [Paucidesulfovibrio longus]|uniref:transcription elongation factor GreA n=1 Tax=Paucidesulfovibrio longus TaxID=889 RepID=UPI0003B76ED3|nr:transcription elongation factor GreA [Paucidesulfovibrio longus]
MESIPISVEGYELVKRELASLKAERPAIIQAIKEAREEGDLSENAGYDAARERQGMLEAKITYIESRVPKFNVIDMTTLGGEKVAFGATVEIQDTDTDEIKRYLLLGPDETSYCKGSISILSPVGRALLGKEVGDEAVVDAPRGKIYYEVLSIEFFGPAITL